jgi:hypothetical protein
MNPDTIGVWIGAILTLLVFSYLLGDTPLFRLAQAIFVGVAVGYATVVAVYLVLLPNLIVPLATDPGTYWALLIPLLLGILLLLKLRPSWGALGNISLAFLFGAGGALAIGGALSGALLPQLSATVVSLTLYQNWDTLLNSLLIAFGTIGALLTFHFTTSPTRRSARILDAIRVRWAFAGRWFILVSFGAIFAGTAVSRVTILISRVYYLLHDWLQVVH